MIQTDVSEVSDLIYVSGSGQFFFVILPIVITQVKLKQEKVSYLLMKKLGSIVASCAIIGILLFAYYLDFS